MNISEAISLLEEMKQSLIENYEHDNKGDELINNKIKALRYIMKFIYVIFRCFPKGFIKKIIKENTIRNDNMTKEIIEKYIQNSEIELTDNENSFKKIYIDEIKLMLNHKIMFSMVKYKGNRYIIMEPKKYYKNILQWKNWERFNFPIEIIKENQFRKRIKEANI